MNRMLSFHTFTLAITIAFMTKSAIASDPFGTVYGQEEFITIATGTKKNTREAPAIVTVIDQEQIKHSSARTLEEVLERVAGIHVSVSQAGYNPIYHIRGISSDFNQQALTMINDVPVTHIYNGDQGVAWSHMPLSVIDKIEIVRGPGSVLYGADAYAGVINIITKNNEVQRPSYRLSAGTFDTYAVSGQQSFDFQNWQLGVAFEGGGTKGFDSIVESDFQSVFDQLNSTNASHAPGPVKAGKDWLDLWAQARNSNWSFDIGYQGRYDMDEVIGWFGALDRNGRQKNEQLFLSGKYSVDLDEGGKLEHHASLFYSVFDTEFYLLPEGNATYPTGLVSQLGFHEIMARYNVNYIRTIGEKHTVRIGLNTSTGRLKDIYENKNFLNDFSPTPDNQLVYRSGDDEGIFINPVTRKNIGILAQDEYKINDLSTLTLGVRYDYYNDFGTTFNPRAAWVYQINEIITSKILYGTAFLAPSNYQLYAINNPVRLGNPDLKPDSIRTVEGSLIFQLAQDELFSINIYQNKRDDIISIINGRYENSGRQKGVGMEVEYKNDITHLWSIRGNIAVTSSIDMNTDTQAAFVPQRQYFLESLWRLNPQFSMNLEAFYIADRARAENDTREDIDNHTLVNFTTFYEPINEDFSIKLGILNLFDSIQREPTTFSPAELPGQFFPANDLPLPGRQVFAELRWQY